MMTEKLYYQNPYQSEFKAEILEKEKREEGWALFLNRTQFYPEGGGQPSDRGTIDTIPLIDVRKEGDQIAHIVPTLPGSERVMCRLNWKHRFDYMQQHTAQHILSAVLFRDFGISTLSVHLGEEFLSIETDREEIDKALLEAVDKLAQELIGENLPVESIQVDDSELEAHDLRREAKVTGLVRLIRIGEYDTVACGGVHCGRTGEVKLIRLHATERIRGHLRLHWKAGDRAFLDYRRKIDLLAKLSAIHSVKEAELEERNLAIMKELGEVKGALEDAEKRRAVTLASELRERAGKVGEQRFIAASFEGEDKDLLKHIASAFEPEEPLVAVLSNRLDDGLQWLLFAGSGIDFPFSEKRKDLLTLINGKGGGRPPLWQGIAGNPEGWSSFVSAIRDLIEK
jgi:alanyl-tRNA synthetase